MVAPQRWLSLEFAMNEKTDSNSSLDEQESIDPLSWTDLRGTPTGTPEGDVICDSCNKRITSIEQLTDGETAIAYLYVTGDRRYGWSLRWVSCHDCGPLGDGEATEPGETYALAFLTANHVPPHVEVGANTILDSSPPAEGNDQ